MSTEPSDYTCVLSGPLARKTPLLASLDRAGADLSEPQHLDSHWAVKYGHDVDPTQGWVHCRTSDLAGLSRPKAPSPKWTDANGRTWTADEWHAEFGPAGPVALAGWRLVGHWITPDCGECNGTGHVNHGTEGLGTCLHCRGVGRTNLPAKTAEQKLLERVERLEAQLAGRG